MVYSVIYIDIYLLVSLSPISIKNIATGIQCFVTGFLDGIQCDIF